MDRKPFIAQQQKIQHIIQPPMTVMEQLTGARQNAKLLDGIMPRATTTNAIQRYIVGLAEDKKAIAITITYKQHYQILECEQMKEILQSNLRFIYNQYNIPFTIGLLPDEDVSGNFHYHGTIIIKRRDLRRFKHCITVLNGFMKTRYISDTELWSKYIMKSYTGNHRKCPEAIYDDEDIRSLSIIQTYT